MIFEKRLLSPRNTRNAQNRHALPFRVYRVFRGKSVKTETSLRKLSKTKLDSSVPNVFSPQRREGAENSLFSFYVVSASLRLCGEKDTSV